MPRILRNYLISFAIIGLFFLAVHLVNRYVGERTGAGGGQAPPAAAGPSAEAPRR